MNSSEGSIYPNLWGTVKTLLRGKKTVSLMYLLGTGKIENEQNTLSSGVNKNDTATL